jgi:hypothetical protein
MCRAVSSIPVVSAIALPICFIVFPLRFQTWMGAGGGSWGELPWSQSPSKRLLLSVVLSSSLDEVTSMSFTAGRWAWTSRKFFALSVSSLVRRFAACVVYLMIALCADVMIL